METHKSSRRAARLGVALPLVALAACGDSVPAQDETGVVVAEVKLAPADARCIQIKSVGATTVTQSFDVAPQISSVLTLKNLPPGAATISAAAYNIACSAVIASSVATYVSDPLMVTVTLTAPVNVAFVMRANVTVGSGTATIDFPTRSQVVDFNIPAAAQPMGIAAGPDNNIWFAERAGNKIGRMTTSGVLSELTVPTAGSLPTGIVAGPDGNMWFAENLAAKIGRVTPSGVFAEFPLAAGSVPRHPVAGPDGAIWFLDTSKIGRITTWGQVTTFAAGTYSPSGLTACSDGNLWYTGVEPSVVGRITPAGVTTTWAQTFEPSAITCTPDGKVWVVEGQTGMVAQGTTAGFATASIALHVSTGVAQLQDLVAGPDGAAWFVGIAGVVGRVTPFAAWPTPRANSGTMSLTLGPDGALWFTQSTATASAIGRLAP
jgi:streptogramin lyase